jgi:hypothetical protein
MTMPRRVAGAAVAGAVAALLTVLLSAGPSSTTSGCPSDNVSVKSAPVCAPAFVPPPGHLELILHPGTVPMRFFLMPPGGGNASQPVEP